MPESEREATGRLAKPSTRRATTWLAALVVAALALPGAASATPFEIWQDRIEFFCSGGGDDDDDDGGTCGSRDEGGYHHAGDDDDDDGGNGSGGFAGAVLGNLFAPGPAPGPILNLDGTTLDDQSQDIVFLAIAVDVGSIESVTVQVERFLAEGAGYVDGFGVDPTGASGSGTRKVSFEFAGGLAATETSDVLTVTFAAGTLSDMDEVWITIGCRGGGGDDDDDGDGKHGGGPCGSLNDEFWHDDDDDGGLAFVTVHGTIHVIPEPSTALLLASGLVALAVGWRRRV